LVIVVGRWRRLRRAETVRLLERAHDRFHGARRLLRIDRALRLRAELRAHALDGIELGRDRAPDALDHGGTLIVGDRGRAVARRRR
jgi:hypothetical protein